MALPNASARDSSRPVQRRSLSRAAYFLFGAVTVVSASCAGLDFYLMREEAATSTANATFLEKNNALYSQLIKLQTQIAFDVVQVQQYLSDYSATRGLDGQDDGLPNAEKFAKRLDADTDAAIVAAQAYESPKLVDAFTDVRKLFPEYYSRGVEMAKVYAAEGPSAGNKIMKTFDHLSDEMQEKLEATNVELSATKDRHTAEAQVENAKVEGFRHLAGNVGLGSIIVIALTCLVAVLIVRGHVVLPLTKLALLIRALARGDTTQEAAHSERDDE